jgi:hypothetical protein
MPLIAQTEPACLIVGDTAKWLMALPEYPASAGWVLSYELVNAAQRITFSSIAAGDEHFVSVPAVITGAWVDGAYTWRARVSLSGEVYTVGGGQITIQPAFAAATDARSQARRSLDAILAMLEGRATSDVLKYTIAGRSLEKHTPEQLWVLHDRFARMVKNEEAAAAVASGLGNPGRVYVRFGP